MGGVLKALDLVDWVLYMAACNVLPPVPAVFGEGWREEWLRRIEGTEPWLLRWLEEQSDGPYWRHGSLRPGYERIACPTMIVAGWADGYTNIALRAYEAMTCPRRVIIGPWAHMSTATSIPGPHIDLVPELIRWFSRWLRDERNGIDEEPPIAVFVRRSTRPGAGSRGDAWRVACRSRPGRQSASAPTSSARGARRPHLRERRRRHVGLDLVRREAAVDASGRPARGRRALAHLRLGAARGGARDPRAPARPPHGHLAPPRRVPLGAALRRLPRRHVGAREPRRAQPHAPRRTCRAPSRSSQVSPTSVELELEATSWIFEAGHRLRLALAGSDWPNTWPPPHGGTSDVERASVELELPVLDGPPVAPRPTSAQPRPARSRSRGASRSNLLVIAPDRARRGRAADPGRHRLRVELRRARRREDRASATTASSASRQQPGTGLGERARAIRHRVARVRPSRPKPTSTSAPRSAPTTS